MMNNSNMIVVAVDVGTTQICAVMGLVANNICSTIGTAHSNRTGVKHGVVVDREETAFGIREAINMLQNKTGHMIGKVYIGINGRSLKTIDDECVLSDINTNITKEHVSRLGSPSFDLNLPENEIIKKIYPQSYLIDGYNETPNPTGHFASSLTAKNKLLVFSNVYLENLKQSISKARLQYNVERVSILATADLLLSDVDREKGIALVDMGGGTTDLIIYSQRQVRHIVSVPLGAHLITLDLASELGISIEAAEKLKLEHGRATQCTEEEDCDITINDSNAPAQVVKLSRITYIIQCRIDEILSIISSQITSSKCRDRIQNGMVLTGRGSLLKGCIELLEKQHSLKARIAHCPQMEDLGSKCSVSALAILAKVDTDCSQVEINKEMENPSSSTTPSQPQASSTKNANKKQEGNSLLKGFENMTRKLFRDPNDNDDLS